MKTRYSPKCRGLTFEIEKKLILTVNELKTNFYKYSGLPDTNDFFTIQEKNQMENLVNTV